MILDFIILGWLAILTIVNIYMLRIRIIYFKKLKNKRDIKSKRYVIFEIIPENTFENRQIENQIRNAVKELGGNIWLEIANPKLVFTYKNYGIISTNRVGYKIVLASLPYVREIDGKEILLVPRRTTGSLKKAKKLIGIR
ncbi:MAG: Rpp14/Pop5 family protein [Sulfolobaceae archaeon]|nr:Rpp14/Pop5 family protein [Sulfolobaceae archaeon]